MYAYANEFHDDYHVIEYTYTNSGNTDSDEDIELPNQTLNDVYFFRIHRWRGNQQGAWAASAGQVWGKYSMVDVVGDGHTDYPVDFTAQYLWFGFDPEQGRFSTLGGPLWDGASNWVSAEDSVGRLASSTMVGRAVIHADNSSTDPSYIRCTPATIDTCQPRTLGFMDQDEPLTSDGSSHEDYFELGILTRENPARFPGGSTHMWPHYADRIEPGGEFWNPSGDASTGKQGGHAATTAYGPYTLAPGESVTIKVIEGIGGLSQDAATKVGVAYKRSGGDNNRIFEYDANGDGVINNSAFDYSNPFGTGAEAMTKDQWVMTARDSLFKTFQRGFDLYEASANMSTYPIPEPPRPPRLFSVFGRPNQIELTWEPDNDGPTRTGWEVYRTERFEDYIFPEGCKTEADVKCGYELIATLDPGATSFNDQSAIRGVDYYYYLQAVGQPGSADDAAINGTPGGVALRSGRYFAQTYQPATLKRPPYGDSGTVSDARVVPNPVNLGADGSVRFAQEDRVAFFNIPGNCTIKIFSEIGELVHVIEHTDGSGDETWNLTTRSRQLLVSGIYIAVIQDNDQGGDPSILKFTVIR